MAISVFERYKAPEGAHGFVQWKGTDVCMDFICECGNYGHIDDAFVYHIKCEACGTMYGVNPYVQMVKMTPEEIKEANSVVSVPEVEGDEK